MSGAPLAETTDTEPADVARDTEAEPQRQTQLSEVVPPLAQEIRRPLLAIRTYASLLEQRPDDEGVRRELTALVDEDLGRLELQLQNLERFTQFGTPKPQPFDLTAILSEELDRRQDSMRAATLAVVRELDDSGPPLVADEEQIRFAIGALLDRALRMIPRGGDLYVGSVYHPAQNGVPARHRLLLRFHSPEDVLLGHADGPQPGLPLDVLLARDLIERSGGSFAVDTSGAQDNVIFIEL